MCKDYAERNWESWNPKKWIKGGTAPQSHNRVETEREIPKLKFML